MRRTSNQAILSMRAHLERNPSDTYSVVAKLFSVSIGTVKRHCGGTRGKSWRLGKMRKRSDPERVWKNILKTDGCWIWQGSVNKSGYGTLWFNGKQEGAYRVAYSLEYGPIAPGLEIHHHCNNRLCCNPDHLEAVTRQENMRYQHQNGQTSLNRDMSPYYKGYTGRTVSVGLRSESYGARTSHGSAPKLLSLDDHTWGQYGELAEGESDVSRLRFYIAGPSEMRLKILALNTERAEKLIKDYWGDIDQDEPVEAGWPDLETIGQWLRSLGPSLTACHATWLDNHGPSVLRSEKDLSFSKAFGV